MIRYALLAAPGLGSVVEHELNLRGIKTSEHKMLWLRNHDILLLTAEQSALRQLLRLRTVDDIFAILEEEIPVDTKTDLKRLTPRALRDRVLAALPLMPPRRHKRPTTHFAVFVKQDSDREVYRREIEGAVGVFMTEQFSRWKAMEPADVEFWAFYVKKKVTLGMRLTRITFRQRKYRTEDRPGSLRPTLAAALIAFTNPQDGDVIFDPMCGSGTILLERALWGNTATVLGCDVDAEALEFARNSAEHAKVEMKLLRGDSTDGDTLSEYAGKISHVVTNLPFGKQFEGDNLEALYRRALTTWKTLLVPGGTMVLLTPHEQILNAAAKRAKLWVKPIEKVRMKGTEARVYRAVVAK